MLCHINLSRPDFMPTYSAHHTERSVRIVTRYEVSYYCPRLETP